MATFNLKQVPVQNDLERVIEPPAPPTSVVAQR